MRLGFPCKVTPEERSISNRVKGSQKQASAGEILSSCFFPIGTTEFGTCGGCSPSTCIRSGRKYRVADAHHTVVGSMRDTA